MKASRTRRAVDRIGRLAMRANSARRRRGVAGMLGLAARKFAYYLQGWAFDKWHGVETNGLILLKELEIDSSNVNLGYRYQATPPNLLRRQLRQLEIRWEDFIFVDFGSGEGRTLLVASEFPFKKIIGIEFSIELHEIASRNIRSYRNGLQRCKAVESVCMDAIAYPIPNEPVILYFFHPFEETVMRLVLANIERSLEAHPRDIRIVYYNPVLATVIETSGHMERAALTDRFGIYRSRVGRVLTANG